MKAICSDLRAEHEELDALVDTLNKDQWHLSTPFYDFTVKDQIEHLAYFDDRAIQAVADAGQSTKLFEMLKDFPLTQLASFVGIVLVIVIMFLPDGLIGFAKNLLHKSRPNK